MFFYTIFVFGGEIMAKLKRFSGTPVAEGVRLEVGSYTVVAVRNEQRDISVRLRREPRGALRTLLRIPFLRGITRLFRDIARFFDGLNESSELNPQSIVRGSAPERAIADFLQVRPQAIVSWVTGLLIPIIAFVFLFAAPLGADKLLGAYFDLTRAWQNTIVCAVRILGTLLGVGLICRLRVFNRLQMYRGAINQVTNCYECRDEITIENAAEYPLLARRSECAFLLRVLVVSMALFSLVRPAGVIAMVLSRIGILLATAAVINEPIIAMESAEPTLAVRIVRGPYDFFQRMTTLEPHPQMLEVAVCAFQAILGAPSKEEDADDDR